MDTLFITPSFAYSYQCGSTLLTSYLPVFMYSISLQIFALIAKLIFIFSSDPTRYPPWLLSRRIYWPSYRTKEYGDMGGGLVEPYQIISTAMNNIILLLSFGLCSPILCCYITSSLCLSLTSWQILIGRFVYFQRRDISLASIPTASTGLSFVISRDSSQCLPLSPPSSLFRRPPRDLPKER